MASGTPRSPLRRPSKGGPPRSFSTRMIQLQATSDSPKLTGEDTVLCWIIRRIQPLQHRDQLLCEYTSEVTDPQQTCQQDFEDHHLTHRMNQLVKNRSQYTESFPMYTQKNPSPQVAMLMTC